MGAKVLQFPTTHVPMEHKLEYDTITVHVTRNHWFTDNKAELIAKLVGDVQFGLVHAKNGQNIVIDPFVGCMVRHPMNEGDGEDYAYKLDEFVGVWDITGKFFISPLDYRAIFIVHALEKITS